MEDMRYNTDPRNLRSLLDEEARLKTFDSWEVPFMAKETLAKNGFYYRGNLDRCVCIFCGVEIGEWEEGDDPYQEHRKFSPECAFFDLSTDASRMEKKIIRSEDECGCVIGTRRISKYITVEARFETFQDWPISMKQKPKQLAQAGFYYTGNGDKVICFSCDLGIYKWEETDDPWFEHARWSPECGHVLREKGQSFVDHVQEEVAKSKEESEKQLSAQADETEKKDNPLLCAICKSQERRILSLPCRHLTMCKGCSDRVVKCPVCRTEEKTSIEVIFP